MIKKQNNENKFDKLIQEINKSQFKLMTGFVSQANNRAGKEIKFEWEDKSLFDCVDFKFNEVEIYLRDSDKREDDTHRLIQPINNLIKKFNSRLINYYEFIIKFKQIESNLVEAEKSERYSIRYENFELQYADFKSVAIKGVGGMGKSHFLWECQNEIQNKNLYASLFIYGKYFNDVASIPWADISEYAKEKEFLLVIDGINEIADADKRNYLYSQISSLLGCKYIRIFVSYRTYSLQSLIGGQNEESFIDSLLGNTINFAGVDFDSSIMEIVTNFKVDISYFYTILYSNNPMQLRMLIESEILNNSRLYEEELSSKSVVSITFIYERFIKSACKHLWKEREQIYWEVIKDLCKVLYQSNRSYFFKEDICSAGIDSNKFIADLKNGGYIDTYDYEKYYFSWEQLSNYLIARSFNDEIKGKTDDEIIALYSKKALEFPRISQFLISVLVDKYHKKFDKFISFITKANPDINEETLLNIVIKNISDRQKLQHCLSVNNTLKVFSVFGGIPKRVFNCETYFFKDFFDRNTIIIKDELFYGLTKAEVFRKLKNNLHNLNGKYFNKENANEFLQYAILCLLIPDNDIVEYAEKTIYDLIELYDDDFSNVIFYALNRGKSPLIKRSIYNVVCHLSADKKKGYSQVFEEIERNFNFTNAKIIDNYCHHLKLPPFKYVHFRKKNLFLSYSRAIPKIKSKFDEYKSLGGIIATIRTHKLFYALNMEYYNKLKLNFELIDLPKREILRFNRQANSIVSQFNKCNCSIEVWDNMFNEIIDGLQTKIPVKISFVNQEDLFYGFVAHLYALFNFYGITDEDLKWFKDNSYRQHKLYPDNVTFIINVCVEEYIGSLMCNYFQSDCKVSYWDNQIYLGYSPMKFDEDQIKLCTPLNTYNEVIDKLDLLAIKRLNESYTCIKNTKWADSKCASFKSIKSILAPYSVDGVEWIMLGCYITNHNYYKGKGRKKDYSEECIIVSCATNYSKNRTCSLDRDMTIEIQDYNNSVLDYADVYSDFCKLIEPIKTDRSLFEENNLSFPPSSIISRLGLKFDSKRAAWVNNLNEAVILCNNNLYRWHKENIGRTIYIKKEYFEEIKDVLQLYYYIFTEKLSYETGHYSNESDMHIIIKNDRIRKVCKNNASREADSPKIYKKCLNCSVYKAFEQHEIAIDKAWYHFDEYFD